MRERDGNDDSSLQPIGTFNFSYRRFLTDDDVYTYPSNDDIVQIVISGRERKTRPDEIINIAVLLEKLGEEEPGRVSSRDPTILLNIKYFTSWYDDRNFSLL